MVQRTTKPPHTDLVNISEKFCKWNSKFVAPRVWGNVFICGPFLPGRFRFLIHSVFEWGHKSAKNRTKNWGWWCKKWQECSFVIDNVCRAIAENWHAWLDEPDLFQKRKPLETAYKKCPQLLQNYLNFTYAFLLEHAHKSQPSGGVKSHHLNKVTLHIGPS